MSGAGHGVLMHLLTLLTISCLCISLCYNLTQRPGLCPQGMSSLPNDSLEKAEVVTQKSNVIFHCQF